MNIYSIKEILKATNNFLDTDNKDKTRKDIKKSKKKITSHSSEITREEEKSLVLTKPLVLNNKSPLVLKEEISNNKINQFNYKINIKSEVKNVMIDELYVYLKKKIKKNTLKLIIEEQLEKKNLENKIKFLNLKESKLSVEYQLLKDNYKSAIENNKILKIKNDNLQGNLEQISNSKKEIINENEKLKINLTEANQNLKESIEKNRSFEINNAELKNTISRYIVNYKKLQENIKQHENSKKLEFEDEIKKVKFYQDENIRLSSELLLSRKKNETIKMNLNDIELEKQKISNKIKELNNSIVGKSNIISPNIIKEIPAEAQTEIKNLDDKEQKTLDEVINKIFAKIK
jgi:hypothetical protein